MRYEDELHLLESLGRGRKTNVKHILLNSKHRYYQKGGPRAARVERKTSDMLRTAAGKKQAILKISSYGKGR
jgi:hypothetical protein